MTPCWQGRVKNSLAQSEVLFPKVKRNLLTKKCRVKVSREENKVSVRLSKSRPHSAELPCIFSSRKMFLYMARKRFAQTCEYCLSWSQNKHALMVTLAHLPVHCCFSKVQLTLSQRASRSAEEVEIWHWLVFVERVSIKVYLIRTFSKCSALGWFDFRDSTKNPSLN